MRECRGWLREVAAQVREKLSGEAGCPEWGTRFREIARTGMSVGREISRLVMEQVVQSQVGRVPDSALVMEGDMVLPAGQEMTPLNDAFNYRGGTDSVGPTTHDNILQAGQIETYDGHPRPSLPGVSTDGQGCLSYEMPHFSPREV